MVNAKERTVTQSSPNVCSARTATKIAEPFWTIITHR